MGKPRINKFLIGGIVLVCFFLIGLSVYFLGKQSNKSLNSTPVGVTVSGWRDYTIPYINASFQYPPNLIVATGIDDSTELAADHEYWVMVGGSDIIYLAINLYGSNKTPTEWWNSEGKNKFDKVGLSYQAKLTYNIEESTFAGRQSFEVMVSSDFETHMTPKQNYLTIVQQKDYIVMFSYYDQGSEEFSSLDLSRQILSTFKFND